MLAIILGIVLFGTVLSPQSQVGVVVVITGVILYSRVSFLESAANKVDKKELPTALAPLGQVEEESK